MNDSLLNIIIYTCICCICVALAHDLQNGKHQIFVYLCNYLLTLILILSNDYGACNQLTNYCSIFGTVEIIHSYFTLLCKKTSISVFTFSFTCELNNSHDAM